MNRATLADVEETIHPAMTVSDRLPWVILVASVVVFGLGFAWLSVLRHAAFQSHAFDLGNMDQAVWNTLRGAPLRFTDMQPRSYGPVLTTRLAIHVEPILLPISLLYLLHSGPETLLVLQALVVATGAIPAYVLARRLLGSPWLALVFPAAYLLHPSLQNALLDDFHPVTMSAALLMWAIYFVWTDSVRWFVVTALLSTATKEEVGLLVALLALPMLRRHRVLAVMTAVAAVTWFAVCLLVIIPHFNPAGHSPYLGRYSYLGHGTGGVISGALKHPKLVWQTLTSPSRLGYLKALFDPMAFVPLLGLPILVLALPTFAINMLSSDPTMYSGFYQYSAEVVPYVIVAAIAGVAAAMRLSAGRAIASTWVPVVLCALVLLASLTATRIYGFTPISEGYAVPTAGSHQRIESTLLAEIPPSAVVAAADEVEPHLSGRRTVYLLPTVHPANGPRAQYIVLDASIPSLPVEPHVLRQSVNSAMASGYGVQSAQDGVLVLREGASRKTLPAQFYHFIISTGSRVIHQSARWGPLSLTGVVVHPTYQWINRSRPAAEIETYWKTACRLKHVRIRFYVSPVYGGKPPPLRSWSVSSDSPTWDWLPVDHWPVGRTIHAASLPFLPGTDAGGKVDLAVGVSGLAVASGVPAAQRVAGDSRVVRLATITVRP